MSIRRSEHIDRSRPSRYIYGNSADAVSSRAGRHKTRPEPTTCGIRSIYAMSKIDRKSLVESVEASSSGHLIKPMLDAAIDNDLDRFLSGMRSSNVWSTTSVRFRHGLTPLIVASRYNATKVVRWICLNEKVALECKDTQSNTALHHAVASGNNRCVAALLDAGALVQSQNIEGATPLHFAAYYGHKDAVRCLLSVNSSAINIKDNTGKTPLMLAAFRGRTQVVSVLLSVGGGQINEQDNAGWTALMYAAFTGRIAICREMLEFVASRIIADYKTGKSAADLAQEAGYYEVADMLQNKEVALRTPSLPEHINMPTARPLPYAVTTNPLHVLPPAKSLQQSVQWSLRPAIERALSPLLNRASSNDVPSSSRSTRPSYVAPRQIKPPPIPTPPATAQRHISPKSNRDATGQRISRQLQNLGGLKITIPTPPIASSTHAPPLTLATPSTKVLAPAMSSKSPRDGLTHTKKLPAISAAPVILVVPEATAPSANARRHATAGYTPQDNRKKTPTGIATVSTKAAGLAQPTAIANTAPAALNIAPTLASSAAHVAPATALTTPHANARVAPVIAAPPLPPKPPMPGRQQKLNPKPILKKKLTRNPNTKQPAPESQPNHAAAPPLVPKTSSTLANPQPRQHPLSPQSSGPLHTPINVAPDNQACMQPSSGWSQRRPPPSAIAPVLPANNTSTRAPETSPNKAPATIPDRIRETMSRASLKYLDSRTEQALKHDASHIQASNQPLSLAPGVTSRATSQNLNTKFASPGLTKRRKTTSATRRMPISAGPYKRYHDSSWIRPYWRCFSLLVTLWMPNFVLDKLLKKETPEKRQAWREKIALCLIIMLITALTALISFGLSSMFCHPVEPISLQLLSDNHGAAATRRLTAIRGRIYDVTTPSDAEALGLKPSNYGDDSSWMFAPFPEESQKCKHWPSGKSARNCYSVADHESQCAPSDKTWSTLRRIRTNKWVVYQWDDVLRRGYIDKLFVYNEKVYSLKPYLASISPEGGYDEFFGHNLTQSLKNIIGTDATIAVSRNAALQKLVPCWESQLRLGRIEGTTVGCVITSGIMISVTVILNLMILIKLVCAVLFDWAFSLQLTKITKHFTRGSSKRVPHVVITVTCYNKNEETIRATLDSVAMTNYASSRKILFIIADGDVETTDEKNRTTPQILRSMIVRTDDLEPIVPLPYMAIGEGPREFNAAEVIPGFYISPNGITVPCILIIKVGTKRERDNNMPKAGNRGKRDSQLIVLQWLRNVMMNDHLTPLEFELCRSATQLAKLNPDQFEYLLMVDADTTIDIECIPRLVAAMERDPGIMGLCGETRIANKRESWVTRIQVYEYYISHHLSKAFESLWGGVTCLPGCCSMYRIFSRKADSGSIVPLLIAPEVIEAYSSNETYTLHQKNLLLLGEDRYLTTVLLRAFPKRKLIYVPRAICRTTVPNKFSVLVSQRRRWINSTIHNLLELILVQDLCGTFCCSMQFLVLMDLLGNVVLPASVIFSFYLVVAQCVGSPVALPLMLMALAFALQGVMILITTQRVSYIYWMCIYIAAIPLWNFVMPVYAFWRFDDFSWGKTRMAGPEDNKADFITDDERLALEPIPLMRWKDWMRDNLGLDDNVTYGNLQQGATARAGAVAAAGERGGPENPQANRASQRALGQTVLTPMPVRPVANMAVGNLPTPIARLKSNAARTLHQ